MTYERKIAKKYEKNFPTLLYIKTCRENLTKWRNNCGRYLKTQDRLQLLRLK